MFFIFINSCHAVSSVSLTSDMKDDLTSVSLCDIQEIT
jgi:hypothetical protein